MRAAKSASLLVSSFAGDAVGLPKMVDAMFAVSGGKGGAWVVGGIGFIWAGGASLPLYRTHTPIR